MYFANATKQGKDLASNSEDKKKEEKKFEKVNFAKYETPKSKF